MGVSIPCVDQSVKSEGETGALELNHEGTNPLVLEGIYLYGKEVFHLLEEGGFLEGYRGEFDEVFASDGADFFADNGESDEGEEGVDGSHVGKGGCGGYFVCFGGYDNFGRGNGRG